MMKWGARDRRGQRRIRADGQAGDRVSQAWAPAAGGQDVRQESKGVSAGREKAAGALIFSKMSGRERALPGKGQGNQTAPVAANLIG